ncbi:hypothetical protein HYS49_02510, partial [Candidatus Woesearchaeota archaeon]|nr:hypothetical protein [Candidatus Woesearchaeota archaeon]
PKYGKKSVECPGLKFSCTLVKLQLQDCRKNGDITFLLENASTDDLKVDFSGATSKKLTYSQSSYSTDLKNLSFKKGSGNSYTVKAGTPLSVDEVQVSLPRCVGPQYVYAKLACVALEEAKAEEQSGKELKCGGYLDLEDRVRCRLRLREEQRDDYENFFPEECTSWKNQDQCVALYRKVQECWDQEKPSRIACLRQKVGVLNVQQQKAACGEDQACHDKLRLDVYTLIKLRLYNLEEEAEELLEAGKVTEDDVADFVIKMEQSKLAFNAAQSKQERISVIVQAQRYWQEFVRKVKS